MFLNDEVKKGKECYILRNGVTKSIFTEHKILKVHRSGMFMRVCQRSHLH